MDPAEREAMIGLRIGQKRDPSAVCVVERELRGINSREEIHFIVRYLERLPLATPFPAVADRVADLIAATRARSTIRRFYVDATGMGRPLIELLESRDLGTTVVGTYFTYGDRRTEEDRQTVRLGKAYLVTRLLMLLQSGRVHLPRTVEAETLRAELLAYEPRVYENANEREGAFKVGTHDDLVTALGLAIQLDEQRAYITSSTISL